MDLRASLVLDLSQEIVQAHDTEPFSIALGNLDLRLAGHGRRESHQPGHVLKTDLVRLLRRQKVVTMQIQIVHQGVAVLAHLLVRIVPPALIEDSPALDPPVAVWTPDDRCITFLQFDDNDRVPLDHGQIDLFPLAEKVRQKEV